MDKVGIPTAEIHRGNGVYRCLAEGVFRKSIDSLQMDPCAYTFIDIGSGKVMFTAADLPFKRIVGIEYAEGLHDVAVRNVASYQSRTQKCHEIVPVCADALQYKLPQGPLVLFIFNALAQDIMVDFLGKLDAGPTADRHRPVLLIYANLRSVRESGNPFSRLNNLQVGHRHQSRTACATNSA